MGDLLVAAGVWAGVAGLIGLIVGLAIAFLEGTR